MYCSKIREGICCHEIYQLVTYNSSLKAIRYSFDINHKVTIKLANKPSFREKWINSQLTEKHAKPDNISHNEISKNYYCSFKVQKNSRYSECNKIKWNVIGSLDRCRIFYLISSAVGTIVAKLSLFTLRCFKRHSRRRQSIEQHRNIPMNLKFK